MFLLSRIFLLDLLIISFLRDGIVDEVIVFLIEIGMEKLGGHLLQFGYLLCHLAAVGWLVRR